MVGGLIPLAAAGLAVALLITDLVEFRRRISELERRIERIEEREKEISRPLAGL